VPYDAGTRPGPIRETSTMTRMTKLGSITGDNAAMVAAAAEIIEALVSMPRQTDPVVEVAARQIASRRARLDDLVAAVRFDYCAKDLV
jgi:hypothetical protein